LLNQNNKRKIDSLRDILVGKVPDPKSQIEQIMIALLYKFMNDMDLQAKEYGGEPSFFVKDFKKFSWEHIFSSKVSGVQLVELYSEGIESMETNPNIPQLFRDIFKNALLTYKDPETLRLFLNQINEFTYTADSEQLGDAFEYLLNFLSSQGDAGQFRTPRHIIDFIVEIVNPNKDNSIVDPASGTSGFLISAFKHIEKSNTNEKTGDLLSAKERTKIMSNIVGYDISPDMVRIGLANMYLHGFNNPKVYEYDALTSEERWNEYFDIVLANPPFFTPKGGIKPHNKFQVSSSKTEVLFLDYIISHLKPGGKAGIIVPEGVLENNNNKQIRGKLVKSGLFCIVSLPRGVFSPYSPTTKTSILFIDKKKTEDHEILFSKIENDGFSLGLTRNKIEGSDLPYVSELIKNFIAGEEVDSFRINKDIILNQKFISLSIKDYTVFSYDNGMSASELFNISKGKLQSTKNIPGKFNFYTASKEIKTHNEYTNQENSITYAIGAEGSRGNVHLIKNEKFIASDLVLVLTQKKEDINLDYFYYFLKINKDKIIENLTRGSNKGAISMQKFSKLILPCPPIEEQNRVVKEINIFNKKIQTFNDEIQSKQILIKDIEKSISNEYPTSKEVLNI
tara:strand:+ start:2713 stop:4578 length:1866 start_codon:yes stop_codon:yes gene_type:complete